MLHSSLTLQGRQVDVADYSKDIRGVVGNVRGRGEDGTVVPQDPVQNKIYKRRPHV